MRVIAYHVVFGTYGFWLPNDPRGSWSDFVGSWELLRFGPATKTDSRCSVAGHAHDHEARLAAKEALQRPAVQFTGIQARAIGRGFALLATGQLAQFHQYLRSLGPWAPAVSIALMVGDRGMFWNVRFRCLLKRWLFAGP